MTPSLSRCVGTHAGCHGVRSRRRVCWIPSILAAAMLAASAAFASPPEPLRPAGSDLESLLEVARIDPGTPGYQQLGAGYDVFTAYADAEFVKNPVLDIEALNDDGKVGQFPVDKFTVNQFQGTTIEEYVSSFAVSAGLSGS